MAGHLFSLKNFMLKSRPRSQPLWKPRKKLDPTAIDDTNRGKDLTLERDKVPGGKEYVKEIEV
jgi:hypothetical protein